MLLLILPGEGTLVEGEVGGAEAAAGEEGEAEDPHHLVEVVAAAAATSTVAEAETTVAIRVSLPNQPISPRQNRLAEEGEGRDRLRVALRARPRNLWSGLMLTFSAPNVTRSPYRECSTPGATTTFSSRRSIRKRRATNTGLPRINNSSNGGSR